MIVANLSSILSSAGRGWSTASAADLPMFTSTTAAYARTPARVSTSTATAFLIRVWPANIRSQLVAQLVEHLLRFNLIRRQAIFGGTIRFLSRAACVPSGAAVERATARGNAGATEGP
jgi:hypothetical protein